jgi:hypothetical protein
MLQGVHYGMFPGAGSNPTTVWTAVRPHNWRPTSTKEWLVELDMETGEGDSSSGSTRCMHPVCCCSCTGTGCSLTCSRRARCAVLPARLAPLPTGKEVSRVAIPSRFTHDVVRANSSVYVCDTGNGRVLELSFPDMTPVGGLALLPGWC